MLSKIKALPKLTAALAVAAALVFGTTQALAGSPCTPLPPHTCKDYPPVGVDCDEFCVDEEYWGGQCLVALDCCVCLEK